MKKLVIFCFILIFSTAIGQGADGGKYATVIATGYGKTETEAMKSAFSSAVEQVLGVMVSSEMFINSGNLIHDKILTKSTGFIKSYEKLGYEEEKGYIKVTLKAQVSVDKVNTAVVSTFGKTTKIDGKSLYAEVLSSDIPSKVARIDEILAGHRHDILNKTISLEIDDMRVNLAKSNEYKTTLTVYYTLSLDKKSFYQEWDKVLELLESLGIVKKDKYACRDGYFTTDRDTKIRYEYVSISIPEEVSDATYNFLKSFSSSCLKSDITLTFMKGNDEMYTAYLKGEGVYFYYSLLKEIASFDKKEFVVEFRVPTAILKEMDSTSANIVFK